MPRSTAQGFHGFLFDSKLQIAPDVTHLLISAPPDEQGDPVLRLFQEQLQRLSKQLKWVGYLSTTGVYGDRGGDWVDEDSPLAPNTGAWPQASWKLSKAGSNSITIMDCRFICFAWPEFMVRGGTSFSQFWNGSAKRIIKPGQIFSRIHVDDIAGVLAASIAKPNPGRAYNVCDDEPCPPQEVVEYAANLLGLPVPPEIPFEDANLSPMAKSFYADSKRVSNKRIKNELGYKLLYPNYREGLSALKSQLTR